MENGEWRMELRPFTLSPLLALCVSYLPEPKAQMVYFHMAKNKKQVINLSEQNISFTDNNRQIKLISFNPNTMDLDVSIMHEGAVKKKIEKFPFAHLPKELKKIIKPN